MRVRFLLLTCLVFATVAHVRGEPDSDDLSVEDEPVAPKPKKTVAKTVAKTTSAAAPKNETKAPAGITNASPAKLFMHTALRDYVTLSGRFTTDREECRIVPASAGLPSDLLVAFSLLYNSADERALMEFHSKAKESSLKHAAEIGCKEEAEIFWTNADMLVGTVANAHRDVIREVQSAAVQQKQASEKKTEL